METKKIQKKELQSLVDLYDWHSRIFSGFISELLNTNAHIIPVAFKELSHVIDDIVQKRYDLANATTVKVDGQYIRKCRTIPSLEEYRTEWERITTLLKTALLNLDDDQLNRHCSFERPVFDTDTTLLGAIGFFIYRETYAIGQISLWQEYWGNSKKNCGTPVFKTEQVDANSKNGYYE